MQPFSFAAVQRCRGASLPWSLAAVQALPSRRCRGASLPWSLAAVQALPWSLAAVEPRCRPGRCRGASLPSRPLPWSLAAVQALPWSLAAVQAAAVEPRCLSGAAVELAAVHDVTLSHDG
ncbi:MAG: hypothetical protein EOS07_22045 [Mesorhizobium sp.]|nr:MAG: hypothetical protein EOS07_22045 [Mesorhizobium sp.]